MKGSSSRSPCRLVGRSMVTLRSTCNSSHASPTSLLGTDLGPQSPTVCSFLLSDFLLSVAAPSLSLVLVYGTIYFFSSALLFTFKQRLKCSYFVVPLVCTLNYHTNCVSPTFTLWLLLTRAMLSFKRPILSVDVSVCLSVWRQL